MQLGVIAVYGFAGAFQAGQYFITYAIAGVVLAIPYSFLGVMFPVLSGMGDGRKRASWRAIRLTSAVTAPVVVILAVYARVVLEFFGSGYVEAWPILVLLLVGVAPFALIQGVNVLAYAYGFYSLVLGLGVAISLPRALLYLFLTPWFGAAEAFLAGTLTGVVGATVVAGRIGLSLDWKLIGVIFFIPLVLGLTSYFTGLWWFFGTPLILAVSFLAYTRLRIVSKEDMVEVARGFLPQELYKVGVERLGWLVRILYRE
jgi:O-antigen/teichoic acid export membrane protein